MENPASVGVFDGGCDGPEEASGVAWIGSPARDQALEGAALEVAHREEMCAFVLTKLIDGHDVRVLEGGGSGGFSVETVNEVPSGRRAVAEQFERDNPIDSELACFEHNSAAATTQLVEDFVIAKKSLVPEVFWTVRRG